MKHFTFLRPMLLLCALIVGVGSSWADVSTLTFEKACGGTGTANDNVVWTITSDGAESNFDDTKGIHYGTSKAAVQYIKLSTSDIKDPITSVKVNASTANSVEATVSVTVGGAAFGGEAQALSSTATDYTFTGSATGEIIVTVTKPSSATKALYVKSIVVEHGKAKTATELLVEETVDMYVGDTKNVNDLYAVTDGYDGTVTLTSSDEEVAKIEGGQLVAVAAGTAVITVTAPSTENYNAAEAQEITVNVASKDVTPEGPGESGIFELVTDATTLTAGDKLLIIGGTNAMSTKQNSNNRGLVEVSISDSRIETIPNTAEIITLEGSKDEWYFKVAEGYLYAASSSSNYLRTETEKDDNAKATIEITEGNATIIFQGTNTRNELRYNSSSSLFSCYASTSTMDLPQIYRAVEAKTFDIAIGETGYKTLVSTVDATLPEGLKAYVVTATSSESATLTEVAAIKANTPYILQGAEGDYTLTIAEKVDAPAGNLLQISTESTANGVYVLANSDNVVGFYTWAGGQLGAGRVYLPKTEGARDFLAFSFGEATAIKAVEDAKQQGNVVYNLAGQRVAQPTRGLYIVNGKKVVLK